MTKKKTIHSLFIIAFIFFISSIIYFFYTANQTYKINRDFEAIALQFNPADSSSSYESNGTTITIYGGFVKGIQKGSDGQKRLVLRALSPLPTISIETKEKKQFSFILENINPDLYSKLLKTNHLQQVKLTPNTLQLTTELEKNTKNFIETAEPSMEEAKSYVILGDNRDGYDVFAQIIQQTNALSPAFVIDNGDLVFSGKPNQYRLFHKLTSELTVPFYTTLGNHDIRGNGKEIYTMLYGPSYFSFDFLDI